MQTFGCFFGRIKCSSLLPLKGEVVDVTQIFAYAKCRYCQVNAGLFSRECLDEVGEKRRKTVQRYCFYRI